MDYISGVLGDVTAEQADFEWDGDARAGEAHQDRRDRLLPRKGREPSGGCFARRRWSTVRSSRATSVAGREAVEAAHASGVDLRVPLDQLARIDFSTGKIAYLSDLKSTSVRWIPRVAIPQRGDHHRQSWPAAKQRFVHRLAAVAAVA